MPPAGKPVVGHRTDFRWHVTGDGPRRAIRPGRISQGPVEHVANWNGLGSEHGSVPSPPCCESEPFNPKGVVPSRAQDGVVARPADQDVVTPSPMIRSLPPRPLRVSLPLLPQMVSSRQRETVPRP